MRIKKEKFVNPLLMWLFVIIGILVILRAVPREKIFEPSLYTKLIFVLCFLYWIYFFISAIIVNKKAALSVASINKLIKTGVYSRVRHPIYAADIILGIGIFFLFPELKVFLGLVWLILVLYLWMNVEESSLIKKFGKEYEEYRKKVPMFIPKKFN